ncbi:MAG: hypothetical protein R6U68_02500 [Desulfobacteraceae bacterium]
MKIAVFEAAGGNPTAICYETDCTQKDYGQLSRLIQKTCPGVEQVGFYKDDSPLPRLDMAGGEFCGNAARSFACFLKEMRSDQTRFTFKISGFEPVVTAEVTQCTTTEFFSSAAFKHLTGRLKRQKLDNKTVRIVDLGGIVHVVVNEDAFPFHENSIRKDMETIRKRLNIDCSALGLLRVREKNDQIFMKPVVWVKDINTCFYETACGSGSIAVGLVKGEDVSVIQPSGNPIDVHFRGSTLVLSSAMKKNY